MKNLKFSIVTVVKDDLDGLIKTRNSLEQQTYKNWHHFIVYGGEDNKFRKFLQKLNPSNTSYISELDSGIYNAMNKGWKLASLDSYVFFLNSRDVFAARDSLKVAASILSKNGSPLWGCTTHEEISENQEGWVCKLVSPPSIANQLHAFGYRSHQAVVMQRSFINDLGGFDERFAIASDWDLIARALMHCKPFVWNTPLARFELGGVSSQRILDAHRELWKLRRKYLDYNYLQFFVDYVWTAFYIYRLGYRNAVSPFLKLFKIIKTIEKTSLEIRPPLVQIFFRGKRLQDHLLENFKIMRKLVTTWRIVKIRLRFFLVRHMLVALKIEQYGPNQ
jgi:GT2 family glycosyltransferase